MEQVIGVSSLSGWTLLFLCEFLDMARGAHLKWRGSRALIAGSFYQLKEVFSLHHHCWLLH